MAEVVFQNLEDMLPELEELERQGIFARDELRIIIKRRTDFEYKLQKRIMEKQDVLNYLQYELKLDLLQKKRSKRLKLKPHSAASLSVSKRIHLLFRKSLMKFGDDLKLWMQYIDFCKKTESLRAMGLAFGKLLQQHASNPDVWLMAAKHEVEETNNVDNARSILQKALRKNKDSMKLWHEYFRLELLHVDKIKKRKAILVDGGIDLAESEGSQPKEIDQFLSNKTALIVYKNAIKTITDGVEFRLKFIEICGEFKNCDELEDAIYESLLENFSSNELVYEALAKRPILKLKKKTDCIVKEEEWQKAEIEMEEKFQEGLENINTTLMWEKYLNSYAELLQESSSQEQAERRMESIRAIILSAEKNQHISESIYTFWCDFLMDIGEMNEANENLSRALDLFETSDVLWQKYLILKAQSGGTWIALKQSFTKCLSSLKEANLTIWQMYVDAAKCTGISETIEVFEEAVHSEKAVKEHFIPHYLEWIHDKKGIKATRKFYKKLLEGTISYNILKKCINLELCQDDTCVKQVRSLYDKCIQDFGKINSDIWLDYIIFEKEHCTEQIERVGMLYNKAKRTLEGKLNATFLTRYSLLQTQS